MYVRLAISFTATCPSQDGQFSIVRLCEPPILSNVSAIHARSKSPIYCTSWATLELSGGRAIDASSLPIFFGLIQRKDRPPSIAAIFWYVRSLMALSSSNVHQRRVGLQAPRVDLALDILLAPGERLRRRVVFDGAMGLIGSL